jgi:aryl-alcohol dehydrogenase-like predicted oxidoreductase
MKKRKLGNSDLEITPIGFGAWAIGGDWQFGWGAQQDVDSMAAIRRALELGVNWIDTAAVYGLGHSEEIVGKVLADWSGPRPYVFTKCGMTRSGKNAAVCLRQRYLSQPSPGGVWTIAPKGLKSLAQGFNPGKYPISRSPWKGELYK